MKNFVRILRALFMWTHVKLDFIYPSYCPSVFLNVKAFIRLLFEWTLVFASFCLSENLSCGFFPGGADIRLGIYIKIYSNFNNQRKTICEVYRLKWGRMCFDSNSYSWCNMKYCKKKTLAARKFDFIGKYFYSNRYVKCFPFLRIILHLKV